MAGRGGLVDRWKIKSGTVAEATPSATRLAQDGIFHIITSIIIRNTSSSKLWTFKDGDVDEMDGDIGDETLIEQVELVGSPGKLVSISTNGNGRVYIAGYSVKLP